jgi:hypothetical protein
VDRIVVTAAPNKAKPKFPVHAIPCMPWIVGEQPYSRRNTREMIVRGIYTAFLFLGLKPVGCFPPFSLFDWWFPLLSCKKLILIYEV